MQAGDKVRVLHPFGETYAGQYVIAAVDTDGTCFLEGVEGGFDPIYLEKV